MKTILYKISFSLYTLGIIGSLLGGYLLHSAWGFFLIVIAPFVALTGLVLFVQGVVKQKI